MNAAPLVNRAQLGNARNSQTESLEARVARLEALVSSRQSARGMVAPAPKTAVVKPYPKMDVEAMRQEAIAKAANTRALETKILQNFSGVRI